MKSYIVGLIMLITFLGCQEKKPIDTPNPTPGLEGIQGSIKKDATDLEKTTANIKKEAVEGEKKTPEALKPTIGPHFANITTEAGKQDVIVADLKNKDAEITKIKKETEDLKKFAKDETTRANKAEASLADALTKRLYILIMFGALGVAAGVFLMFMGNTKMGIAISVTSGALIVTSLIISTTAKIFELAAPYVAAGIGLIVVAALGYGAWYFIQKKKEAAALKQNVTELVATAESTKQLMPEDNCRRMFGDGALVGMAHIIQSKDTQKLVSEVRKQIKLAPPIQAMSMVSSTTPTVP